MDPGRVNMTRPGSDRLPLDRPRAFRPLFLCETAAQRADGCREAETPSPPPCTPINGRQASGDVAGGCRLSWRRPASEKTIVVAGRRRAKPSACKDFQVVPVTGKSPAGHPTSWVVAGGFRKDGRTSAVAQRPADARWNGLKPSASPACPFPLSMAAMEENGFAGDQSMIGSSAGVSHGVVRRQGSLRRGRTEMGGAVSRRSIACPSALSPVRLFLRQKPNGFRRCRRTTKVRRTTAGRNPNGRSSPTSPDPVVAVAL